MRRKNSALIATPKPSEKANSATHHPEESMRRFRTPQPTTYHPTKAITGLTGRRLGRSVNAWIELRDQHIAGGISLEPSELPALLVLPKQFVPRPGLYFRTTDELYVPVAGREKFRLYYMFGTTPQMYQSDGERLLPIDERGWVRPNEDRRHWVNPPQFALFQLYCALRRRYAVIQTTVCSLLLVLFYANFVAAGHQAYALFLSNGQVLHYITPFELFVAYLTVVTTASVLAARSIVDIYEDRDNELNGRVRLLHFAASTAGGVLLVFLVSTAVVLMNYEHPWGELMSLLSSLLAGAPSSGA